MATVILSAFGDEAAESLTDQMSVLEPLGIRHIELRGVWGKNVSALSDPEVGRVRHEMGDRGFSVSSIGSPIGKVPIEGDWAEHLDLYRRVLEIAAALGTRYVRLFSFFMPGGKDVNEFRGVVMDRLATFAELAGDAGLVACHENESGIYGTTAERCADILNTVNSPHLRAVFDPGNFVHCGVNPRDEALPLLRKHVEYVHVKDALAGSGKPVPAGQGVGHLRDVITDLVGGGFSNYLTLEPHLANAGRFAGFSGPELFATAARALTGLLDEAGVSYV